jgi:hypothetical protein
MIDDGLGMLSARSAVIPSTAPPTGFSALDREGVTGESEVSRVEVSTDARTLGTSASGAG